jgi:Leucine-rich repeat (LRR) protein
LPQELGNLTELVSIDIRRSDLEAGSVPNSIASCTKLVYLILLGCKLQGEFPSGFRKLKSIGIPILNQKEHLSLNDNSFTNGIPEWICELVLLTFFDLEKNSFDGKIPACIGSLILLKWLNLSDNDDLAGELPIGICDLASLEYFEIEGTSVEGNLSRLYVLKAKFPNVSDP